MIRFVFFLSLLSSLLFALPPSFHDATLLHHAKEALLQGACKKALRLYRALEFQNDAVRYNLAGCLYRLGDYRHALDLYRQIQIPRLNALRYYNMGNTLFWLGRYDAALAAWRNTLKFLDDPDAKNNILLLEKWLEKRRKEQGEAAKEKKEKIQALRKGFNTPDQLQEGNRTNDKLQEAKIHDRSTRANLTGRSAGGHGDAQAQSEDFHLQIHGKKRFEIRDGIEERYWDSRLGEHPMQTLLIPIPRKGADRELPLW